MLRHRRSVEADDTESVVRDPQNACTASLLESATLASGGTALDIEHPQTSSNAFEFRLIADVRSGIHH